MKLLLIGALPPPLGGATVLFSQLVNELAQYSELRVEVINTTRADRTLAKTFMHGLRTLVAIIRRIRHVEIVGFHASIHGAAFFGPLVSVVCYLWRRPWIFRGFGGYYPDWYRVAPMLVRWVFRHTVLGADIVLFETRHSVEFFSSISRQPVRWYSNSRVLPATLPAIDSCVSRGAHRFVYLGHVTEAKGVDDLIHSSRQITGVTIDAYGPLTGKMSESAFEGSGASYRGVISPEMVPGLLRSYDVLVIPSRSVTEGYPGVVLEAFCAGLPVIASRIGAIPEIVDERSGILVEPGQVSQLVAAMKMLRDNPAQLTSLRLGAQKAAQAFSSARWTEEYVKCCEELCSRG